MVAHSEDFMILSCVVLTQYSSVTDRQKDGQTDRQTDASAVAKMRLALHAVARKNCVNYQLIYAHTPVCLAVASTAVLWTCTVVFAIKLCLNFVTSGSVRSECRRS